MDAKMSKEMEQDFRKMLQERLDEVKHEPPSTVKPILAGAWTGYRFANSDDFLHSPDTGVAEKTLVDIGVKMHTLPKDRTFRSEEHTSELQSLMRISYAVFCLKKKKYKKETTNNR